MVSMKYYTICELLLFVSITVISCIFVVQAANQAACFQKVDYGNCKESLSRYYFDHTSGNCMFFRYKGCRGNSNNFQTLTDCEKFKKSCLAGPCFQKVDYGNCKENSVRLYFDYKSLNCYSFPYKGCRGNSNNFQSYSDCQKFKKSCMG